jgi:hypothetical protein
MLKNSDPTSLKTHGVCITKQICYCCIGKWSISIPKNNAKSRCCKLVSKIVMWTIESWIVLNTTMKNKRMMEGRRQHNTIRGRMKSKWRKNMERRMGRWRNCKRRSRREGRRRERWRGSSGEEGIWRQYEAEGKKRKWGKGGRRGWEGIRRGVAEMREGRRGEYKEGNMWLNRKRIMWKRKQDKG